MHALTVRFTPDELRQIRAELSKVAILGGRYPATTDPGVGIGAPSRVRS